VRAWRICQERFAATAFELVIGAAEPFRFDSRLGRLGK
jgi:hypothetical protein